MILSIFKVLAHCISLFWEALLGVTSPILHIITWISCKPLSCSYILNINWHQISRRQTSSLQVISLLCLILTLLCRNFLVLYNLVYQFGHLSPGLWALLENHCLSYVFTLFNSPGFRFLGLLIYLELIFVQCERQGHISVLHRDIQMSQYHMLRHYYFPSICPWSLCCEL